MLSPATPGPSAIIGGELFQRVSVIALGCGVMALGAYVGACVLFVGGVVQVIEAAKLDPVDSRGVGVGLLRVALSGGVGFFLIFFGGLLIDWLLPEDTGVPRIDRTKTNREVEREWEQMQRGEQ